MKGKGGGKKRVKRAPGVPIVDLSCCKYELLRMVLKKNGWEEASADENNSHLVWTDMSIGPERLMTLKRGQKINHYFGMLQICRKKSLARSLSTMRKMFPSQYKFFPRSFVLPNQLPELLSKFNFHKVKTFILKPDNGCQGRGVALAQSGTDVRAAIEGLSGSNLLAQKYIANPMLINGYKFDLRIYVLIISCDPLRLYLYREGLVRFCTEKYSKPDPGNLSLSCMHITNYAVNKHSGKFEFNTSSEEMDKGHKWTLTSLYNALDSRGYDIQKLHRQISQLVVMTIIGIVPLLVHNYHAYLPDDETGRTCFELLGMDVLLDEKCKPWLLEVNHSPSFSIDTPLDLTVKEALLLDTLRLVHMDPSTISKLRMQERKGAMSRLYGKAPAGGDIPRNHHSVHPATHRKKDHFDEYEKTNRGLYDRIFPPDDKNLMELYKIFLAGSEAAFKHSFHMRIKETIIRVQEERKQEEIAKENEEKKKQKARSEIRKKAQKNARLAALAARARLVEKLTAQMAENLQTVVAVGKVDQAPTPINPERAADKHALRLVEVEGRSEKRESRRGSSNSSARAPSVSSYKPSRPTSRGGVRNFSSNRQESLIATPSSRTSASYAGEDYDWEGSVGKVTKGPSARQTLTTSKVRQLQSPWKSSTRKLEKCSSDQGDSISSTPQYQQKLPAVQRVGGSGRTNALSLTPATLAQLGSKYYLDRELARHSDVRSTFSGKEAFLPSFTDLIKGNCRLPSIGHHGKNGLSVSHVRSNGARSASVVSLQRRDGESPRTCLSSGRNSLDVSKTEPLLLVRDVLTVKKGPHCSCAHTR